MVLTTKNVRVVNNADASLNSANPTWNYGAGNLILSSGAFSSRIILRFVTPNFSGTIKSIDIELKGQTQSGSTVASVYLLKNPQSKLWIEGTAIGGPDVVGCTWDDYAKGTPWDTAGGDHEDNPIAIINLINGVNVIDLFDGMEIEPNTIYTFLLKLGDETNVGSINIDAKSGTVVPELNIGIENEDGPIDVSGFYIPDALAVGINSTVIRVQAESINIAPENFLYAEIRQIGPGLLATIYDPDNVFYDHSGLVVQGDVDDFDEDLDTYPNGKTESNYYILIYSIYTIGTPPTNLFNGTTIPAIRPASLTFAPRSIHQDESFIDDNRAFKPYGIKILPAWYDSNDITLDEYIAKTEYEVYWRKTSTWGTVDVTEEGDFNDLVEGLITEGDTGYKPYKIKGRMYDTGGLYRKATLNKTSEQFTTTWPAPCPSAIPDGAYADAPPNMGGPFLGGSLVPVDLSRAGQQSGDPIYIEDFLGTSPGDAGKWKWIVDSGISAPIFSTGLLGAPIIESTFNPPASGSLKFTKILRDEGSIENDYNKWLSKYTGGYRVRYVFRIDNWDRTGGRVLIHRTGAGFYISDYLDNVWRGYTVRFSSSDNNLIIYRRQVLGGTASQILLSQNLGIGNSPMDISKEGKFFLVDITISPYFSSSGDGDSVMVVYNIADTLADVLNIDYDTHPNIYSVNSIAHPVGDLIHYIGRHGFWMNTNLSQTNAIIEVYNTETHGRIGAVGVGQGYGAKNLTLNEIYGLVNGSTPTFTINCEPDQASQLCYIEGRIKNEYGAQSRTGEVDDFQGDTFTNNNPVAFLLISGIGLKNSPVVANASLSFDPEGGDLIYEYDFGDSSPLVVSSNNREYHNYTAVGTYTVKLRVQDEAGIWSNQVESDIIIPDVVFIPLTFICPEPFTDMAVVREDGNTETPIPGIAASYYQNNKTGGRKFSISGATVECANLSQSQLIDNAKAEIDLLDLYYKEGSFVEIDLPLYGTIKGFISSFRPQINESNPRFWTWSMIFKEVVDEQLEG